MSSCNHNLCVNKVPIFSELKEDKLLELNELVKNRKYKSGELIYMEGDIGEQIYIIESGLVKLSKTSKDGNEYITRLVQEGQFFGELVLFKEESLNNSAEAVGDCSICLIDKNDIEDLVKSSPDFAHKMLAAVTSRLNRAETQLQSMALEDAREKTIRLLLELAKENGIKGEKGVMIDLPLSRKGLANLIGISQETLSRKLSELQEEGFIEVIGQKKILLL